MARITRYLSRALLGLCLLIAIVVTALMIYVRTESFGDLLRSEAIRVCATTFRGEIAIGSIGTSIGGDLRIRNVCIRNGGARVVWLPRLRISYSLIALLWHEIRLNVTAFDPIIRLERQENNGTWNVMQALALRAPSTNSGAGSYSTYIDSITVQGGTLEVAPSGFGSRVYRLEQANLEAQLAMKSSGLKVNLSRLHSRLVDVGMPVIEVNAVALYQDNGGTAKVTIDALRLTTPKSAVLMTGTYTGSSTPQIDTRIVVEKLAPLDVLQIRNDYPVRRDLSGEVTARGPVNRLHVEGTFTAGSARLTGSVQGDLTDKAIAYHGKMSIANADLHELSLLSNPSGIVDIAVVARGRGIDVSEMTANATVDGHNLAYSGVHDLDLQMKADLQKGSARFNARFMNGPARVTFTGKTGFTSDATYHIVGSVRNLNTALLVTSAPQTDVNGSFVLDGRGTERAKANARLSLHLDHSAIAPIPIDVASMKVKLASGRLEMEPSSVASQGTMVSIEGIGGIHQGDRTAVTYRANMSRATPWLKLAGIAGDGVATLQGTATGIFAGAKVRDVRLQGTVDSTSVHMANLSIANGEAKYSVHGLGQGGWPDVRASAEFSSVEGSGVYLRASSVDIRIDHGQVPQFHIALSTRDSGNHEARLNAQFLYQQGRVTGDIRQLAIDLSDGKWNLAQPALFARDSRSVTLENFALQNGDRALTLNAQLARDGPQRVGLHANAIDLGLFGSLMPKGQTIAGTASGNLLITGPAAAPVIKTNVLADDIVVNTERIGDFNGMIDYGAAGAVVRSTLIQDANHKLTITGTVPLKLSWSNGIVARVGNNQNIKVYSAGVALGPFASIVPQSLNNAVGLLQVDLLLNGSVTHPVIHGTMRLVDAGAEVVALGIKVSDIRTEVRISPTELQVSELSARSGDGTLAGAASISLQSYSPTAINGHLNLHHWKAVETDQYHVTLDGHLQAEGSIDVPGVSGQVELVDTSVYPDLAILGATSELEPDNTIVVIQPGHAMHDHSSGSALIENGNSTEKMPSMFAQMYDRLSLDIGLHIPRNSWVHQENAEVELEGALKVEKRRGSPIQIVGRIETVRGWISYHERRFALSSGQVVFTGGRTIDPSLDISAQYTISSYTVEILVSGTVKKPKLRLQSEPQLVQADILSLIFFGETTNELGRGQKAALRQQAQLMATGTAAATVGQAISASLGLESLGISSNGGGVGVGRYLTKNTYLSISPSLARNNTNIPTPRASIQYYIQRWISVTTATMSDGSSQIFVNISKRY